jgi:hypothetical protein
LSQQQSWFLSQALTHFLCCAAALPLCSWAPAYVRTAGHVKLTTSLWAVLLGMIATLIFIPVGGYLADKGWRKVG